MDQGRGVVDQAHGGGEGDAGAGKPCDEADTCTMKTEVGPLHVILEELPPVFAEHSRRFIEGKLGSCVLEFKQHGFDSLGEGNREGAGFTSLGRRKGYRVAVEVNVLHCDLCLGLATSGVESDFKTEPHPRLLFVTLFEGFPYRSDIVVGQLRLLLGFLFGHAEAVTGIRRTVPKAYCLTHDDAKYFHVIEGSVVLHRPAATFFIAGTPFHVINGILVGHVLGHEDALFLKVDTDPAPRQFVPTEGPRGLTVPFQER